MQVVLDIEKIDVCLISETHFTIQSYIKCKGKQVYHTRHSENPAKRGSAVLSKENLFHHEETKYETEEMHAHE